MFRVNMVFFLFLLFFLEIKNKIQCITSLSEQFIIIQSDQYPCPLTKLMDTLEYINGQEQS